MESKKKINEMINKMEEMIKRACKMEDLMDYQSLTFPRCEIASQVQDANLGQVQQDWLPKVPFEDVYKGYAAPRSNWKITCSNVSKQIDWGRS